MGKALYLNNFECQFIDAVKDVPSTGTPATELNYGILRLNNTASGVLTNPTGGDYYILTAFKRSGGAESAFEIMKVTAVDIAIYPGECRITVSRAQEGTTAKAYVTNDYVQLRWTKGSAQALALTADFAAPPAIGGTTPNTGNFTALTATSLNSGPLAGFRNRIINGGFDVWQRGASIVCTTGTYSADRWRMYAAGANVTVSQDTSVSDTPCYLITGAASNTVANLGQPIESANLDDLVTGPVTISYEVYSSTARAVGITTYYFNTKDSGVGAMTLGPSNTSILTTAVNTWQKVTLTIASLATAFKNGAYIDLNFGAVTAGQTVRVRNVQLEPGSVATPFESRPIAIESAMCKRYTRKQAVWVGTSAAHTCFPIDMRATPTSISGGGAGFASTNTTADTLDCYQTTAALQTLTMEAEL